MTDTGRPTLEQIAALDEQIATAELLVGDLRHRLQLAEAWIRDLRRVQAIAVTEYNRHAAAPLIE